jgi:chromosome segregation ATPase
MGYRLHPLAPGSSADRRQRKAAPEETAMESEMEFLRQQIETMHRMLETCMARICSLEAQVAELERRPVAIVSPEEPHQKARERLREDLVFAGEATFGEVVFWESQRRRKG